MIVMGRLRKLIDLMGNWFSSNEHFLISILKGEHHERI